MKLIIDIPEEYKVLFDTERCKSKFDSLATNEFGYVLRKAFENGTPLDDVKAEFINRYPKNYMGEPELGGASCEFSLCRVLQILDNIGKAESQKHADGVGLLNQSLEDAIDCS